MSAKPKSNENPGDKSSTRKAMPFEPRSTQSAKEAVKQAAKGTSPAVKSGDKARSGARSTAAKPRTREGIPEAVSRRMVKRIALFCGIPTALGMSTFVASYLLISNDLVQLPTYAVLLVSLGWFGLGVLGVSYGLLSASWDEDIPGSRLGISEFKTNFGRMTAAWKENSRKAE